MKTSVLLSILLLAACLGSACAQEQPAAAGNEAADAQKQKRQNMSVGQNGYLKNTPEAEALWKQIGQTMSDLHIKQWELSVLLNTRPINRDAVKARRGECQDLQKQLREAREKLQAFWVPIKKRKHDKAGDPGQQPPAAEQAPANAGG